MNQSRLLVAALVLSAGVLAPLPAAVISSADLHFSVENMDRSVSPGTDFSKSDAPLLVDWKIMMKNFQKNGRMSKEAAVRLLRMALDTFKKEENIVKVPDPVVFVGDILGQFKRKHQRSSLEFRSWRSSTAS